MTLANIFDKEIVTLYHGTTSKCAQQLLNGPDPNLGKPKRDFGQGFYTTTNRDQALYWATSWAEHFNKSECKIKGDTWTADYPNKNTATVFPALFTYELSKQDLEQYNCKRFFSNSREWAQFIYYNRIGLEELKKSSRLVLVDADIESSGLNNFYKQYSYVYGPVADTSITVAVREVLESNKSFNYFLTQIDPGNLKDQLSFHDKKLCDLLKLTKAELIYGREGKSSYNLLNKKRGDMNGSK